MKADFISIIDELLKTFEKWLISDENEKNDLDTIVVSFITKYWEYFNIDFFRSIFNAYYLRDKNLDSTKLTKQFISHRISSEKEDNRTRFNNLDQRSSYNIQRESGIIESEINELLEHDQNMLWYTIFKIFKEKIIDVTDSNLLHFRIDILQNTPMLKDTITKKQIDEYLYTYRSQLSTEMLYSLIDSEKWDETLKSIINNPVNTKKKMDICLFVMEYHYDNYSSYMPKIFEACINCMKEKIWSKDSIYWLSCSVERLKMLYSYYNDNKTLINPELDVEWAFETYSELFVQEDFYWSDLVGLAVWDLPNCFIKMWFNWYIQRILEVKNLDEIDNWLQESWIINNLFYDTINQSLLDDIWHINELIFDWWMNLIRQYEKKFPFLVRQILYSDLNIRLYWYNADRWEVSKWSISELKKIKKELIWSCSEQKLEEWKQQITEIQFWWDNIDDNSEKDNWLMREERPF
jgi:hypothetical protein